MASRIRSAQAPRCLSCIRNVLIYSSEESIPFISRQQIRGKKTNAKDIDHSVAVRLLRDMPGYGAEGALIPLARGIMRNRFFPERKAEYLSVEEIKKFKVAGIPIERNFSFGRRLKTEKQTNDYDVYDALDQSQTSQRTRVNSLLLKPERATDILELLLPANIDFYRKPVVTTPASLPSSPPTQRQSPSIARSASLSLEAQTIQDERDAARKAAEEAELARKNEKVAIYGSVTTADIVANLKAILAEDDEAKRIVFGAEEVSFVKHESMTEAEVEDEIVDEDVDRVKHLGVFEIEIRLKGAPFAVSRTVRVNAAE